jgi:hypothetical protein
VLQALYERQRQDDEKDGTDHCEKISHVTSVCPPPRTGHEPPAPQREKNVEPGARLFQPAERQ